MRVEEIILGPVITEKSVSFQEDGVYSFFIHPDATKVDVKIAMASLFGRPDVESVRISNLPKKIRLVGRGKVMTKRRKKKKAYVRFSDSKTFEFSAVKLKKTK
jgi:large subunit ribosomal protein L23